MNVSTDADKAQQEKIAAERAARAEKTHKNLSQHKKEALETKQKKKRDENMLTLIEEAPPDATAGFWYLGIEE